MMSRETDKKKETLFVRHRAKRIQQMPQTQKTEGLEVRMFSVGRALVLYEQSPGFQPHELGLVAPACHPGAWEVRSGTQKLKVTL